MIYLASGKEQFLSNKKEVDTMKEKFLGCMVGLAIGDALGAPVEFMSLDEIKRKYGQLGIRDFDSWGGLSAWSVYG